MGLLEAVNSQVSQYPQGEEGFFQGWESVATAVADLQRKID